MNLVFFDRRNAAQPAPGEAFLNVQPGGACLLSSGAIASHKLQEQRWVSVAKDTDTNQFFLVFGAGSPESKPFALHTQKNKPAIRTFSAAATARLLCDSFGLGKAKSLRLEVGQPVLFEQQQLFPLQLKGAAAPVVVPAAPAPEPAPAPVTEERPAAPAVDEAPQAPASPAPVLSPAALPESRAEQLADYWYEREISKAEPAELSELLKVLGNTPKCDRGFKENVVLGRAKAENARRGKARKGGNRG